MILGVEDFLAPFAHVDKVMTGFVNRCQILWHPVFVVAVDVVKVNPFGVHKFQPTVSTGMVLSLQDFRRSPVVEFAVPFRPVA